MDALYAVSAAIVFSLAHVSAQTTSMILLNLKTSLLSERYVIVPHSQKIAGSAVLTLALLSVYHSNKKRQLNNLFIKIFKHNIFHLTS